MKTKTAETSVQSGIQYDQVELARLPVCFLPDHWLSTIPRSDEWGPEERGGSQYIVRLEEEQPTTEVHWRDDLEHWIFLRWEMGTRLSGSPEEHRGFRGAAGHWRVKT